MNKATRDTHQNPTFEEVVYTQRNFIKTISIALILLGVTMQAAWIFVPAPSLPHRPFEEDTFFHLSVCRNIASGKGMTIDGKIPTSGAQPGTLIYTLAYLVAGTNNTELALRWVRVLDVLGSIISALALYFATVQVFYKDKNNRSVLALFSAALWMVSYQVFRTNMNGYETVFAVAALLLSIGVYLHRWREGSGIAKDLGVGATMALAIYCRIDLGVWAATAALGFLALGKEPLLKRVLSVFLWAVTALVLTLPFWINNLSVGGSLMPISGKASAFQMTFYGFWPSVLNCTLRSFTAIGEFPWIAIYLPYGAGAGALGILVAFVGISMAILVFCQRPIRKYLTEEVSWSPFVAIVAFAALLLGYYIICHGSWWFMKRYVHPLRAIFFLFSGAYISAVAFSLWQHFPTISPKLRFTTIAAAIVVISVVQFALTWGDTKSNQCYPVAEWINANIPAGAKIGAFQSGTLGYFCKNVVNLDGKNNPYVLKRLQEGTTLDYIREQQFDYITDWPHHIARYVDFAEFNKMYSPVAKVSNNVIYKRTSP